MNDSIFIYSVTSGKKFLLEWSLRTIRTIQIQICSKINLCIHFLWLVAAFAFTLNAYIYSW